MSEYDRREKTAQRRTVRTFFANLLVLSIVTYSPFTEKPPFCFDTPKFFG